MPPLLSRDSKGNLKLFSFHFLRDSSSVHGQAQNQNGHTLLLPQKSTKSRFIPSGSCSLPSLRASSITLARITLILGGSCIPIESSPSSSSLPSSSSHL